MRTTDLEPIGHRDSHRNGKSLAELSRENALASLSPKLRVVIGDLETRAAFMDSPFGFTDREWREAVDDGEELVGSLGAQEVADLIRFYRSAEARKLPLMGNELAGSMLYEQWGRVGGEDAMGVIGSWIIDEVSKINGDVDLTDPFQMNPDFHKVGKMFSGWAAIDGRASRSGLRRLLGELERSGISTMDFEAAILEKFPELHQESPEK